MTYKIVFSPTGGTDKAAEAIVREIDSEYKTIDLSDPDENFKNIKLNADDVAVIAAPSFGGRAPKTAVERLLKIKAEGTPAVIVCAYGNREYEDTLAELIDTAEKCGFKAAAAVSAIAQHSIAPVYAHGRPNADDEAVLKEFSEKIIEKINNQKDGDLKIKQTVPGDRPYKKYSDVKAVPKAKKGCTECGECAEKCPVHAIDKSKVKTADSDKCISCMRCVYVCPYGARTLPGFMKKTVELALKKACSEPKENKLYL